MLNGHSPVSDEDDLANNQSAFTVQSTNSPRHQSASGVVSKASIVWHSVRHHLARHAGAGVMASVAYFDPGNWSVDLQAGSMYGYKLLFVILLAGLGAIVLQVLACKLGCVTGLDLASHCRVLLYNHPRYPRLMRRMFLYPLYVLSEIAIVATDLAELLGSAIALSLIFPKLPLWAGVIVTSLDVLAILAINDKGDGRPVRLFESIIIVLVLAVLICFIILIVRVDPTWGEVFKGYVPSKTLLNPGALYTAIGIIGATVMPHALFLGSSIATLDRVSRVEPSLPSSRTQFPLSKSIASYVRSLFYFRRGNREPNCPDRRTRHEHRENNTLSFVCSHLRHAIVDIVMSLIGFAVPINSAILVLAGTVFFSAGTGADENSPADLFDVHALIREKLGKSAAFMFALALLCSGQSASITATLAGQIVSEGFLEWKISPFTRRLITRLMGLIPSAVVAATIGREGINTLLVGSQVALSIVLPFVMFPLVYLTSSGIVMRVKIPRSEVATSAGTDSEEKKSTDIAEGTGQARYHNGKVLMTLGYLIFVLVVVANAYMIVTLIVHRDDV